MPANDRACVGTAAESRPSNPTWVAYAASAGFGSILYLYGAITPYVAADLRVSLAEASLSAAALSGGLAVAGIASDRLARSVEHVGSAWLVVLLASGVAFVGAPSLPVLLIATVLVGVATGAIFSPVNGLLVAIGGPRAPTLLARSGVWGMIGGLTAPALVAAVAPTALTWRAGFVLPAALLGTACVLGGLAGPAAIARSRGDHVDVAARRLPGRYWVAWLLLTTCIGLEFGCAFWGATHIRESTGISAPDATRLVTLLVAGMLVGRVALGAVSVHRRLAIPLLRGGVAVVAIGSALIWIAHEPLVGALGLFVAGLGISVLYPLGATLAIGQVPENADVASTRLVFASGLALLVTPPTLGFVAGASGIHAAWLLMFVLAAVALALTVAARGHAES
jgi:MFS family permease